MTKMTDQGLDELRDRLASARTALAAERGELARLSSERLATQFSEARDRTGRLAKLDAAITERQRNVEGLEAIVTGIQPTVEDIRTAEARVVSAERGLDRDRATVDAYRALLEICDLMDGMATKLRQAKEPFARMGRNLPTSATELLKLAEGRWADRIRSEATSMIQGHIQESIPNRERQLKEAQAELDRVTSGLLVGA